jgi:hypothetical protein
MNLKNRISHGRLVLATSLIVVASVGAAIGKASTLSNGVAHSRIALATGPPTTLLTPDVRLLEQIESARNTQLSVQTTAVRDGRAFYELVGSDGVVDCWGVGPATSPEYRLGQVACVNFPSDDRPVLDFTVVHGRRGAANGTVWRSEGFAADSVASIGFETTDGRVVANRPVVDGVFSLVVPSSARIAALVASDASGAVIWRKLIDGLP